MCDYQKPAPFRTTRPCLNRAKWFVEFILPDDGKTMRKKAAAVRCTAHAASRFFPKGTTGITTRLLESRASLQEAPRAESDHD